MIIVYTPEGGAPERFDIRSLRTSEASIAQRTLGITWAEIQKGIDVDDPEVLRGVAFVLKKRAEPSLRYSDFDPVIGELVTKLDKREVAAYIQNAFEIAATDDDSREAVAAVCRRVVAVAEVPEHAEQVIAEMTEDPKEENGEETTEGAAGPLPKESASTSTTTSTSSEPSGSDSSPTSATSPPPSSTS